MIIWYRITTGAQSCVCSGEFDGYKGWRAFVDRMALEGRKVTILPPPARVPASPELATMFGRRPKP